MRISDWSSDVCSSDLMSLVEFDLFGAVRDQPVSKVDARERRGQFAQIGCGRTDQTAKLAERPVGWSNGSFLTGDDEREAFGAVAASLDADRSEERRVGKECVSTFRSRWSPSH